LGMAEASELSLLTVDQIMVEEQQGGWRTAAIQAQGWIPGTSEQ